MKYTRTAVVIFLALITYSLQGQKCAYINLDSLLMLMPESRQADTTLQALADKFGAELKKREKKMEEVLIKLRQAAHDSVMMEYYIHNYNEIYHFISKLQDYIREELTQRRQSMYEPIIAKAKHAIAQVAKEKGYLCVLDARKDILLYSLPGDNILDEVKKKLGIR